MSETPNDFRRALSELVETTYPEPAEHPQAERWLAYHRGELGADEEARLEEHLVRCRDCFDLAQAAADFAGEASGEEEGSAAARGLWRLVARDIETAAPAAGRAPAARPPRRTRRSPNPYLLAAVLSMALLGSATWNLVEQREIAALRAPRPDALIVDIILAGERGTAAETTVRGGGPWMLVLHPGAELPVYRLEIRDAASGQRVGSYGLKLDPDLALTLALPAGLPPGRYRLELTGGGFRQVHLLRVTEAGRGG